MQLTGHISHVTPGTDGPWWYLFFDGSCWPNPGGDMGVAWGIRRTTSPDSLSIKAGYPASPPSLVKENLGDWHCFVADTLGPGSNNQAEYHALLGGLRHAHRLGIRRLVVVGDSLLVVKQVNKQWKIKSGDLRPLAAEARRLTGAFERVNIRHISREGNAEVDALSRKGPLLKGDTGVYIADQPMGRLWSRKQAAFIQWAYRTNRLTATELSRVFLTDRSLIRKCAIGDTYGDIGEYDL
jgi:ribonuclease HI